MHVKKLLVDRWQSFVSRNSDNLVAVTTIVMSKNVEIVLNMSHNRFLAMVFIVSHKCYSIPGTNLTALT